MATPEDPATWPMPLVRDDGDGRETFCPLCGDQAFLVDYTDGGAPLVGFTCDSCDYIVGPDTETLAIAADVWPQFYASDGKADRPPHG